MPFNLEKKNYEVVINQLISLNQKYMNFYEQCKNFYVKDSEPTEVASGTATSLEDLLFAESVGMCELTFEEQFHYGTIFIKIIFIKYLN